MNDQMERLIITVAVIAAGTLIIETQPLSNVLAPVIGAWGAVLGYWFGAPKVNP